MARKDSDTTQNHAHVEAIKQLKARYCRLLDLRDWAGWRALFTDDMRTDLVRARTDRGGVDGFVAGVQELLDGVISVHHAHMPEISIGPAGTATGVWSMTDLLQPAGGAGGHQGYGRYHDRYRQIDGVWKISTLGLRRYRGDDLSLAAPRALPLETRLDPAWLDGLPLPAEEDLVELEAIRQLKARYFRFLDTKDWAGYRGCFADDARLEIPATPRETTPDDLAERLQARHAASKTVHQGHLPEIRFASTDTARGIWALNDVVDHAPESEHAAAAHLGYGYYEEEYRREADGWKIAFMRVSYLRDDPLPRVGVAHDDGRSPVSPEWLGDFPEADAGRLDDLEELHQLKARYYRCLDTKDWEGLRAVYASDAMLHSLQGDIAIDDYIADRKIRLGDTITIHHGHMPEIRFTGETTARGHWALHDYVEWNDRTPREGFIGYGHYQEDYRREADGWKIVTLQIGRLKMDRLSEAPMPSS